VLTQNKPKSLKLILLLPQQPDWQSWLESVFGMTNLAGNSQKCQLRYLRQFHQDAPINISNNGPIDGLRAGILPMARINAIAINPGRELIIILRRLIRFQILLVSASVVFPITGEYLVFHSLAKAEM
jgi:hypothetical protein